MIKLFLRNELTCPFDLNFYKYPYIICTHKTSLKGIRKENRGQIIADSNEQTQWGRGGGFVTPISSSILMILC